MWKQFFVPPEQFTFSELWRHRPFWWIVVDLYFLPDFCFVAFVHRCVFCHLCILSIAVCPILLSFCLFVLYSFVLYHLWLCWNFPDMFWLFWSTSGMWFCIDPQKLCKLAIFPALLGVLYMSMWRRSVYLVEKPQRIPALTRYNRTFHYYHVTVLYGPKIQYITVSTLRHYNLYLWHILSDLHRGSCFFVWNFNFELILIKGETFWTL